jgi:dihydroorotate dehydrogenase
MILSKWPSVFTASGVRGFEGEGYWYHRFWEPFGLDFSGACFVAKTTTATPRIGNMPLDAQFRPAQLIPKCIVVKPLQGVVLNSVGLSGPGADYLIESWLKNSVQRNSRVGSQWMVSFMSDVNMGRERLLQAKQFFEKLVSLIEANGKANIGLQINLSCPNVGLNPKEMLDEVQETLDSAGQLGILTLIKLNALVPVEVGIELANHKACDGIVMSNTIPWGKLPEQIDWKRLFGSMKSPLASLGGGGLSGLAPT